MSSAPALHGHVESVSGGIEDRERSASSNLLDNVNPTFSWVRLAQRVPVRVVLDQLPAGVHLTPGMTATVAVEPSLPATRPGPWHTIVRLFTAWRFTAVKDDAVTSSGHEERHLIRAFC